jgi:hypothetical protein
MAKKFAQLRAAIDADPERRARVEEYKQVMRDVLALTALRETNGSRPGEARQSAALPISVSPLGPEHGLYLSTLEEYVAALGGHLEVTAVFPDCRVPLVGGADETAPVG